MASNFTANYQLNQWEAEDAVRRVDFNEDNAKIDAAIKGVDGRVDGKADVSALNAEINARSSAVSSLNSSVSSLNYALSRRGNCQIRTTSYTGNNEKVRTISFPAVPKLIIILNIQMAAFFSGNANVAFDYESGQGLVPRSVITSWSGSQLTFSVNNVIPVMNRSGFEYTVISFYDMS